VRLALRRDFGVGIHEFAIGVDSGMDLRFEDLEKLLDAGFLRAQFLERLENPAQFTGCLVVCELINFFIQVLIHIGLSTPLSLPKGMAGANRTIVVKKYNFHRHGCRL
jgi:hypothetical protein